MKCPYCEEKQLKSKVIMGAGISTLMYFPVTYDEDGKLEQNDGNIHTQVYRCSPYGHIWTTRTQYGKTEIIMGEKQGGY